MTTMMYQDLLMEDPWFGSLPPALITLILENSTVREVASGALVYAAGDLPTGQFAILEGEVRLSLNTHDGKQVIFPIFMRASWFGHLSVLDGLPRFQDAVACGPTRLLFFSQTAFNRVIEQNPRYALDFARLVCVHIRTAMTLFVDMQTETLPQRLAHTLLNLSAANDKTKQRISQEALAAMVGASRQTVNKILKRWEQGQLVQVHYGHIQVCDFPMLTRLARREELAAQ